MNYRLFILITGFSTLSAPFAQEPKAPTKPNVYAKDYRAQSLADLKKKQDLDTQKKLKERSKGRKIQEIGGKVVAKTNDLQDIISMTPQSFQQSHAGTALSILNNVVKAAGIGIQAYGRYKEALSSIVSANEQILEGAAKSFEKIESLNITLEQLIGQKTISKAFKENKSSDFSKGKKILNLFSPSNFINTFNNFTDDLYITDNKAERWENIKQLIKELKEEQIRFDDYMALLEIKFLEKLMMSFHLEEHKNAYTEKLKESILVLNKAIIITNNKIATLKNTPPAKGGFLNIIKKPFGKDEETKYSKTLNDLYEERSKYNQKRDNVLKEIKHYQELNVDSKAIASGREELKKKIAEVRGRRAAKIEPEDLYNEIQTLKSQIQNLQKEMQYLKTSHSDRAQSALVQPSLVSP